MSVLSTNTQAEVEQALIDEGLITYDQLTEIKQKAAINHHPLLSVLVEDKLVNDEDLTRIISKVSNIPYVNLSVAKVSPEVLSLLPQDVAETYMAVPLGEIQNRLAVAMLDADNVQAVDFLTNKIGRPLKVYSASESGIRHIIKQYADANSIGRQVADVFDENTGAAEDQPAEQTKNEIKTIVQDSPISKALSAILEYAAKNRASDIHVEPLEDNLRIRCRIDGVLREIMKLPKNIEPALISRIKILSSLKIDEHRTPQDGQFTVMVDGNPIDLRIAISPVVWGEQVVIRLLDKTGTSLHLEDMGYTGRALRLVRKGLTNTNGMILTSGPTGSGKSTSLYALIQEIKNDSINIVTLEDPVEYKMPGINQIQVNADVGLTFASGLRSILRQDPNVVMVGEIRDKETAQLAVQAALTGHLVFSTLHTNSAAGILPRLLDMGIEPFLIASTVRTVLGQRLVRRLSPEHSETYKSSPPETEGIHKVIGKLLPADKAHHDKVAADLGYKKLPLANQSAYTLAKGIDSPDAPNGYSGRMGLYEVFEVTDEIQQLIIKRATSSEIHNKAKEQGMVTMRQDGYLKALAGKTTLAEVDRVASDLA